MSERQQVSCSRQSADGGRWRRESGFTLIELMVAIFVIAVMIAVVTPHLLGIGQRAQAVACEENQQLIRSALAEYYLEHNTYPAGSSDQQLQALVADHLLSTVPVEPAGGHYVLSESDNGVEVECDVHGALGSP